jgi:hypothetical protein
MATPNPGQFRKGHDPRRHRFTLAECQLGFQRALESIVTRHPEWLDAYGRHVACKFLRKRRKAK